MNTNTNLVKDEKLRAYSTEKQIFQVLESM